MLLNAPPLPPKSLITELILPIPELITEVEELIGLQRITSYQYAKVIPNPTTLQKKTGIYYKGLYYSVTDDYEAAVNDVKNTFATKEEAPLYLGKEDRYMWCVPIDDLYITEVGTYCATGEVNLVAYDPYWYDNEILSAHSDSKTVTVDVTGDVETPPTIHIGVGGDASFYQIENTRTGEKVMLGEIRITV